MDADVTIVGAGVAGLAIAANLSRVSSSLYLLEKNLKFGQGTSSRNSEVIHAGIYYPAGSLKSILCLKGKSMLYDFCAKHDIPVNKCGKLIVATTPDEVNILRGIIETAGANGVNDLQILDSAEVKAMEPDIFALKAIWSPSTGILDSYSYMKQLESNILNLGGNIAYGSEVVGIERIKNGYEVAVRESGNSEYKFTTKWLVNAAGLSSDLVAGLAGVEDDDLSITFCKGEYFRIRPPKNKLIHRLVYPVPHKNLEGVGVHVTIDIAGGVKLGPDVTWLPSRTEDYSVDPGKREAFYSAAKKFLPFLEPDDIYPEMAGIRPKIQKPGGEVRDFYIREETGRGYPGLINLIGIESPGLTSSLAIGEYVKGLLNRL